MSNANWIEPTVRVNATDQIRTELIRAIRDGQLPVGSKLPSEGELAQRFGVSRPVIREALGSLRVLGLTVSYTGKGTFVVSTDVKLPLTIGDVSSEDLTEVRLFLEVPAARLAATRRCDDDLRELKESHQLFAKSTSPEERVREDVRFHLAVAQASGNALLHRLVAELRSTLREQSLALSALTGRRDASTAEHGLILQAVEDERPEEAAEAMRTHLVGVHEAVAGL